MTIKNKEVIFYLLFSFIFTIFPIVILIISLIVTILSINNSRTKSHDIFDKYNTLSMKYLFNTSGIEYTVEFDALNRVVTYYSYDYEDTELCHDITYIICKNNITKLDDSLIDTINMEYNHALISFVVVLFILIAFIFESIVVFTLVSCCIISSLIQRVKYINKIYPENYVNDINYEKVDLNDRIEYLYTCNIVTVYDVKIPALLIKLN